VTAAAAAAALPARADDTQPSAQPVQTVDQPSSAAADAPAITTPAAPAAAAVDAPQEPDSSATANASATQASGANVNLNVKANDPGDAGAVAQSNDASANASASTATDTTATTSGDAAATATQANAQNVNATVRVASPGNNGAVTQSNTASDGWVTLSFSRQANYPVNGKQQILAMFLRASKPGENVLVGITGYRLVNVNVNL
jgi:hypothetical protein